MFESSFKRLQRIISQAGMTMFLASLLLACLKPLAQAHDEGPVHPWGYEGGTGPQHWGEVEQDHSKHLMCREGVRQSPINIDNVPGLKLGKPRTHYSKAPLRLTNNSHTIMMSYPKGSYVEWEGEVFDLVQLHFHHPSEHLVQGKRYEMEIHMVHKTEDHQYAVIAILANHGKGNETIQNLWNHIPAQIDQVLVEPDQWIDANGLFPDSNTYYYYNGSLTTPPCTENVTWFVLEEPIEVSKDQIEYFRKFIEHNARPAQKIKHRIVVELK